MLKSKDVVTVKNFKGLDIRDTDPIVPEYLSKVVQGETPFDAALGMSNLNFLKKGGMRTRNGFTNYLECSKITDNFVLAAGEIITGIWKIENLNGNAQVDRWLILTWDGTTGNMYDTGSDGVTTTNPVLSVTDMKYAYVVNTFGRMYIAPWVAWGVPVYSLGNSGIYLYNGLYNGRHAGSPHPVSGTFAVTATPGGNCTPGIHFASVLFETDSGYISACDAAHLAAPLSVTTGTGNDTMSFTGVPVGIAGYGIIKRHIIVTKIVVNDNGQGLLGYEPFFAVTLSDNVTTVATFDKPDSALVESAKDYIQGPTAFLAFASMAPYGARMVWMGGRDTSIVAGSVHLGNKVSVSPPNRPEQCSSFAETDPGDPSVTLVGEGYPGLVRGGLEQNGIFYVFKDSSTFSFTDNPEKDPVEWPIDEVDAGKGAYPYGIGLVNSSPSSFISDGAILVGDHGISHFNGRHNDIALSEKIWDNSDFDTNEYRYRWSQVVVDPNRKIAFWRVGDPADPVDYIYTLDFKNGLLAETVKFGRYDNISMLSGITMNVPFIALRSPRTAGTQVLSSFLLHYPLLVIPYKNAAVPRNVTLASECIYPWDGAINYDGGGPLENYQIEIPWNWESGYTPNDRGEIHNFSDMKLRAVIYHKTDATDPGDAFIVIQYAPLDEVTLTTIINNLVAGNLYTGEPPGKFLRVPINLIHEQIRLKLSGTNRIFLQQLTLFASISADDRAS